MTRLTAIACGVLLSAASAAAQDRPAWSAELWATEVGEQLVAAVTSSMPVADELAPTLAIMCGPYLRYDPGPLEGSLDWTGRSATFVFDFGAESIERELQYEALDGMFAGPVDVSDPLIRAIERGRELTIRARAGGIPDHTFSLEGSSRAIAETRRACR